MDKNLPQEKKRPVCKSILISPFSTVRRLGNIYTGSLFLGLLFSWKIQIALKTGDKIALYSYGSGLYQSSLAVNWLKDMKLIWIKTVWASSTNETCPVCCRLWKSLLWGGRLRWIKFSPSLLAMKIKILPWLRLLTTNAVIARLKIMKISWNGFSKIIPRAPRAVESSGAP